MHLKHYHKILLAGTVASLTLLLANCSKQTTQNTVHSNYYTRGIGQYPGCPQEDFSPELQPDDAYRNIALLRAAYQSSSYDYNLTAQLVTDGIISTQPPQYLTLSTPDGEKPRREREWMIDEGPYSRNTAIGEDTYFLFTLQNYSKKADKIHLKGSVTYQADKAGKGYELICMGSDNGKDWQELGKIIGNGLPGKASRFTMHSDPNKQSEKGDLPVRLLNEDMPFTQTGDYNYYKVALKMPGAAYWNLTDVNFYFQDKPVELKPSQFFNSTWMSATDRQEWIYVDLGSVSTFDKIILHWINKATQGKIQTSDDAKNWKDIASLPEGKNTTDEIAVKGKARYVRVLMEQPERKGYYMLSEIEVMGKGGLTPIPAAQPAPNGNMLTLSGGNWKLQRASEIKHTGEEISTLGFQPEGWITATVPGTVLSSYKNIGAIPDPNYADNQLNISESFFNSNFWYRNEFTVPDNFKNEKVFLEFDGINWKAHIYLNGEKAGDIEGAFIRGKMDVTSLLKPGKNVLAVEIIKNSHIGAIKEKNKQSTDFNGGILGADNPTFHATIGWDWIPTVRGRNIGIWNDVRLVTTGVVTVSDPLIESVLPLPDTTSAQLTARTFVKNYSDTDIEGILQGSIGDIRFEREVSLKAGEEQEVIFNASEYPQLVMQHPHLTMQTLPSKQKIKYPTR